MTDERDEVADQQFVHGQLESALHDDADVQQRRIDRLMATIDGSDAAAPRLRTPWPLVATIAAGLLVVILVFATSRAAPESLVRAAVDAARHSGALRYAVRAFPEGQGDQPHLTGTLDVRGTDHVFRVVAHGVELAFGRNRAGGWMVRPDGSIEQLDDARGRRWLHLDDHTVVMAHSIEELLEHLSTNHELREIAQDDADPHLHRIVAERADAPGAAAANAEIWIDESNLVHRLLLRWLHGQHARHPHAPQHGQGHAPAHPDHAHPHLAHGTPATAMTEPLRMTFELTDRPQLPDRWFEPATHAK